MSNTPLESATRPGFLFPAAYIMSERQTQHDSTSVCSQNYASFHVTDSSNAYTYMYICSVNRACTVAHLNLSRKRFPPVLLNRASVGSSRNCATMHGSDGESNEIEPRTSDIYSGVTACFRGIKNKFCAFFRI